VPLHRQEAYLPDNAGVKLPHAEAAAAEVLSLPMHPELTEAQVDRITRVALEA
jgi:dTDP-4-amino-4,6-dideoxygalactose transaminase